MGETPHIKLEPCWLAHLEDEFNTSRMSALRDFLLAQKREQGKRIYPPGRLIFNAFNMTPFDSVRVVIFGQDPYHQRGQAHGLSFSVPHGVRVPPSLENIFSEISNDLGVQPSRHGCLEHWARQGVLLLNSVLTVEEGRAGSHRDKGWEQFTDQAVKALNTEREKLVFLLWGRAAAHKGQFINQDRHLTLSCAHPSPYSADKGFFGCRHFSQTNQWLEANGFTPINWELPQ